jgi:hypothetical protein
VTAIALFDRAEWGCIVADLSLRMRGPVAGVPTVAWPVVAYTELTKLYWHAGGWIAGAGIGDRWIGRMMPMIDQLTTLEPSVVSAALRQMAEPAMEALHISDPTIAEHIREKQDWFIVTPQGAAVLNWRGEPRFGDRPVRGTVAMCHPREVSDEAIRPFLNDCNAALQNATVQDGYAALAQLLGEAARLSGAMHGVSQEIEIGILERGATPRHLHVPATDWHLVANGKIDPVVVTDRPSTQRTIRREPR